MIGLQSLPVFEIVEINPASVAAKQLIAPAGDGGPANFAMSLFGVFL